MEKTCAAEKNRTTVGRKKRGKNKKSGKYSNGKEPYDVLKRT